MQHSRRIQHWRISEYNGAELTCLQGRSRPERHRRRNQRARHHALRNPRKRRIQCWRPLSTRLRHCQSFIRHWSRWTHRRGHLFPAPRVGSQSQRQHERWHPKAVGHSLDWLWRHQQGHRHVAVRVDNSFAKGPRNPLCRWKPICKFFHTFQLSQSRLQLLFLAIGTELSNHWETPSRRKHSRRKRRLHRSNPPVSIQKNWNNKISLFQRKNGITWASFQGDRKSEKRHYCYGRKQWKFAHGC